MTYPKNRKPYYRVTEENFWAKTDRSSGCWEWTGVRRDPKHGQYGRTKFRGVMWSTHRLAWTLVNGPIPDGMGVLHTCDNPPCINPAHLMIGTHRENMAQRAARQRFVGEALPAAKLTDASVRDIRAQAAAGATFRSLSKQYGVNERQISKVVYREAWRHVA